MLVAFALASLAADTPEAPAAPTAPIWNVLRSDHAEATSFLRSNWNKYTENYHPSYVLDEDPKTAWVEGAEGDGVGESLTIPVSKLRSAKAVKLEIRDGYQKSSTLFSANAVPKDVTVDVLSDGAVVATKAATLEDRLDWQEVMVDLPQQQGFDAVRLTLGSVYPGTTYKDTCISDVRVMVLSDVPYNAGAEQAKLDALKGWIGERVATAKYFAAQPPERPFAFTHYDNVEKPDDVAQVDAAMAGMRAEMAVLKSDPKWYRGDLKTPPGPLPDGTDSLAELARVLRPADVSFFETPDETRLDTHKGHDSGEIWTNYKVLFTGGPGTPVKAIYFEHHQIEADREIVDTISDWLVEYDAAQHPARAWLGSGWAYGSDAAQPEDGFNFESLTTFAVDANGRIGSFTTRGTRSRYSYERQGTVHEATATTYSGS